MQLNREWIEKLSNAFGPSGFEEEVLDVFKPLSEKFILEIDPMNNLYLISKKNTGNRPMLMLDAHSDEVGFMVQSIDENGLIAMAALGGWVPTNVPAHTVLIRTDAGEKIQGIVASKPPHFMSAEERQTPLDLKNLRIDVGCSTRAEVMDTLGIQIGDPIAPDVKFSYDAQRGLLFGKAFDNRLGCAAVIETLLRLEEADDLAYDVVGAIASQEEVGTRGACITTQRIQPDLAIVFEGSPADDLYYPSHLAQCALKKGTQIRHMDSSYVSHRRLINQAKHLAELNHIPYQSAVRHHGGTNAGRIHLQSKPVPVLVLGVPSRYVHTHYNYAALSDLESTILLAEKVARSVDLNDLVHQL